MAGKSQRKHSLELLVPLSRGEFPKVVPSVYPRPESLVGGNHIIRTGQEHGGLSDSS